LNLGHLYFDIVSTARCPVENLLASGFRRIVLRISDFASLGISTTVESALQIAPFMQNKANLLNAQMNLSDYITREYEKKDTWCSGKNKPKTNPNKPKQTQLPKSKK